MAIPIIMGIVNVTPDSFSDGGKYHTPVEALRRCENALEEGAGILDIGGESTRPGATPVTADEEWRRIEDVVKGAVKMGAVVSVDTYHPETATRALDEGARMINCVYPQSAQAMLALARKYRASLVVPVKAGIAVADVIEELYIDPMIGFGTTRDEDLALLRSIPELSRRGKVLVGASRKRIVKKLTNERSTGKTLGGNIAIALWCAQAGASVIRVHDVRETVQAIKTWHALSFKI